MSNNRNVKAETKRQLTFGEVLSIARQKAGLGLRDVAERVHHEESDEHISFQYLNDLEKGRRNPPSDHLIEELARVLRVSRSYLYLHARKTPPEFPVPSDEGLADSLYQEWLKRAESLRANQTKTAR
jgi:transcriptional regulator with XRE-family HTH domain